MTDSTHLLTTEQLAARWHVTPGHLKRERHYRRGVTYIKIGGSIRYRLADVLAHEEAGAVLCGQQ